MQYRAHRYPADFPVLVRAPIGNQTEHVLNVNSTGARIGGLHRLRRGDKSSLTCYHIGSKRQCAGLFTIKLALFCARKSLTTKSIPCGTDVTDTKAPNAARRDSVSSR
ncbi:MAG: hypothetical protein ACJASZ_000315 [Yoonia sp.]|jgi:hypothetical protein